MIFLNFLVLETYLTLHFQLSAQLCINFPAILLDLGFPCVSAILFPQICSILTILCQAGGKGGYQDWTNRKELSSQQGRRSRGSDPTCPESCMQRRMDIFF